jgi:hypothetical protein
VSCLGQIHQQPNHKTLVVLLNETVSRYAVNPIKIQ